MNQRNAYLIQILEKIGSPLLRAVMSKGAEAEGASDEASKIAGLLSRTVQLSIDLGRMVEIDKSSPDEIESLRVAMAGLAGPIIASQYAQNAKVPSENDVRKLTGALEAVMTFSDNFTPSDDHVIRLENMKANGMPGDVYQINIQYIQAFVPIADVVASFPFGQPEKKLMQDVADKVNAKAKQISKDVFGTDLNGNQQKLCELALVKSLADLYAGCHKTEMNKLMAVQEPDASAQQTALQSVWESFDTKAEILGMMAQNIVPTSQKSGAAPSTPTSAKSTETPQTKPPSQQSPAQSTPAAAPPPASGNPMAMFSTKPKEEGATSPQQPPAAPEARPPAQATPQAPPQQTTPPAGNPMAMFSKPKEGDQGGQQQPPPAPPPPPQAAPPAEPTSPPPAPEETKKQEGGSPMSFFKSPPKEEGEE